jgi:hypothetical protein
MADDQTKGPNPFSDFGARSKSMFEDIGRKIDGRTGEALPRVEEEVKKVITYLNDEVVPQVRQNSSEALRFASSHLAKLAEHLDRRRGGA